MNQDAKFSVMPVSAKSRYIVLVVLRWKSRVRCFVQWGRSGFCNLDHFNLEVPGCYGDITRLKKIHCEINMRTHVYQTSVRMKSQETETILRYTEVMKEEEKQMEWISGLQKAIDYMEEHLTEELDFAEIAAQAYSSNFHFQRVFSILCGFTLGEYIRRRRLTRAGSELAATDSRVIDIALKYGYDSPESFCRAFARFHGIKPTQARAKKAELKSFSPLSIKLVLEGGTEMDYRIEKRDAFSVVAKRKRFSGGIEITQQSIHETWEECSAAGTIGRLCRYVKPAGIFGDAIVGICFDNPHEGDFDYAIGAACEDGEAAKGLTIETIPANTWAVFKGRGRMPEAFQDLYKQLYTEFFPTSNYEPSGGMCIEVYPSAEVHSEDFSFEIWFSVAPK